MVKKNVLALCAAAAIGFAGAIMMGTGSDRNVALAQDAGGTAAGSNAMSAPAGNNAPLTTKDISLEQANQIVSAAIQKARDTNTKMDIAVVDAGGNLKSFARMDGAWIGSIDIAIRKAKTARFFDMPTGEIGKLSQPGGPLYNIEISNGGLISFPGGIPLKDADGTVIGAIGVSGSTVENDHTVAEAGAGAVK
ncbi:MAG TPA: heme-binding protein [Tepidisphaeraceae bacterium]|jgi:uncharacterized protein GlcG (DUF336 family)|nr:heme-binding protein [Tepidisphaeraceae bacterium]